MKPQVELPAYCSYLWESVDRPRADRAASAHDQEWPLARLEVQRNLVPQRGKGDSLFVIRWNPSNRVSAQTRDICGLLHPGMCLRRAVGAQAGSTHTLLAYFPPCFCLPRNEKADDVCHIAATDEQTTTIGWVTQELGHPADRLRFNLAGHG